MPRNIEPVDVRCSTFFQSIPISETHIPSEYLETNPNETEANVFIHQRKTWKHCIQCCLSHRDGEICQTARFIRQNSICLQKSELLTIVSIQETVVLFLVCVIGAFSETCAAGTRTQYEITRRLQHDPVVPPISNSCWNFPFFYSFKTAGNVLLSTAL